MSSLTLRESGQSFYWSQGKVTDECCFIICWLHRSRTFFRKVTTCEILFSFLFKLATHFHQRLVDAGFAGLAYLALFILLSRQMTLSRTPSGVGRLSRWTFFSQSMMDCVSFAGHITFAILAEGRPSMSLMAPAFLGCILFVYESVSALLLRFKSVS